MASINKSFNIKHGLVVDSGDTTGISIKNANGNSVILKSDASLSSDLSLTLPTADGASGHVLQTDGSGNLSWTGSGGGLSNVVDDTTPQLGGSLDVNGNVITSISNGNVVVQPNGSGTVNLISPLKVGLTGGAVALITDADQSGQGIQMKSLNENGTSEVMVGYGANAPVDIKTKGLGRVDIRNVDAAAVSGILFYEASSNGSNFVGLEPPSSISQNVTWTLPSADGTSGQVLKTDGSGALSWVTQSGGSSDVVDDTSPQLGGNLDVNGSSIVSVSNGNISISPNGSGNIILDSNTWPNSDGTNGQILQTNGSGVLSWVNQSSGGISNVVEDTTPELGGDLITGNNAIRYASSGAGISSFIDFTHTLDSANNQLTLSSVKSINMFLDANGGDSNQAFRIYNNLDPEDNSAFSEGDYIFKASEDGSVYAKGSLHIEGNSNELRFYEGANYVGFEAPALTGDTIWVLPNDDGTSGQVLKTDGSGNLSWVAQSGGGLSDVVDDTSPQLGGDLDVNGNSIVSTSNAHITIAPNGSGDVYIQADTTRLGDQNSDATLTTNGTGDLILSTNQGINSGTLKVFDGINGNILLEPNGSGKVGVGTGVTPNTLLHVKGATPGVTIQRSSNDQDSSILFAGANGYIGAEIKHVNTDNDLAISVLDGNGSVTERIKVSDDTVTVTGTLSVGGNNNELRFYEGANYVGFEAPALAADKIWVLPAADGTSGQVLKTDGSGNLGWVTAGGGGISDVVQDTTPQLGGNLDVNGSSIVSTNNGDISLSPNGSGRARVNGTVKIAADDSNFTEINTTNNGTTEIIPTGGSVSVQGSLTAQRKVIVVTNSNVTLTAGDSGALVIFDSSTGRTVTLPDVPTTNDLGTWFEFFVADNPVESVHKIIVDDTTNTRFAGSLIMFKPTTDNIVQTPGGSDFAISFNGGNTGKIDTTVRLTCVAPDKWMADPSSIVMYSGNAATPFANS